MTMVALPQVVSVPQPMHPGDNGYAAFTLNASGAKYATVLTAPKDGTIDRVCFRTGTVTTPTNTDVRLESMNSGGAGPSGSLLAAGSNATLASGSITANTWIEVTLTTPVAVNEGDRFAIVLAPTGTPNYQVSRISSAGVERGTAFTATDATGGGTYTASSSGTPPVGAVRYNDGTYPAINGLWPLSTLGSINLNSGTTPDEVATKFQLSYAARVIGCFVFPFTSPGAPTATFRLYSGTTALMSKSIPDFWHYQVGPVLIRFDDFEDIAANTDYRIAWEATHASNRSVIYGEVPSAAVREALPGGSASIDRFTWSERTDAGAWSDNALRRTILAPAISHIDIPAGGSPVAYGFAA